MKKQDLAKKMYVRHETGGGQYKGDTNERDVRINGKFPSKIYRKDSGKASLNRASGKNEGEKMFLGRNEQARA